MVSLSDLGWYFVFCVVCYTLFYSSMSLIWEVKWSVNIRSEVKWTELKCCEWVYNIFFKLCVEMGVLSSNQFSLIFLYNLTHGFFTWSVFYFMYSVLWSMLFYFSMSWYNFLCYCILSLCYCILLFYCAVRCYLFFCVLFLLLVMYVCLFVQGGSNMTGTNCDLFTHKSSRSYLNHLVHIVL
jgi:hypothetical protein